MLPLASTTTSPHSSIRCSSRPCRARKVRWAPAMERRPSSWPTQPRRLRKRWGDSRMICEQMSGKNFLSLCSCFNVAGCPVQRTHDFLTWSWCFWETGDTGLCNEVRLHWGWVKLNWVEWNVYYQLIVTKLSHPEWGVKFFL